MGGHDRDEMVALNRLNVCAICMIFLSYLPWNC